MSGIPVHNKKVVKSGEQLRIGRDAVWDYIRKHKSFTLIEVGSVLGGDKLKAKDYIQGLCKAGYLESKGHWNTRVYTLIKDTGNRAPKVRKDGKILSHGTGNQRMWENIKIMRKFSRQDLVENTGVTDAAARDYIKHLLKAGYLKDKRKSHCASVYVFLPSMNTGEKAPMIQKCKQVYDPNICEVVYKKEPQKGWE